MGKNNPMKSDEQRQKWDLRNVGLNLRVEMTLRNIYGHEYGHKENLGTPTTSNLPQMLLYLLEFF